MKDTRQLPWLTAVVMAAVVGLFFGLIPFHIGLGVAALTVTAAAVSTVALLNPVVRYPLLFGFVFRAGLALVQAFAFPLPGSGNDDVFFEAVAWNWSRDDLGTLLGRFSSGSRLYSWFVALAYAVTDRSPLMIQAGNVLLGTLLIWLAYRLARDMWGDDAAMWAAWAVALHPTLAMNSALVLREIPAIVLLMAGMVAFVAWVHAQRGWTAILAFGFIAFASGFHSGMAFALVASMTWAGIYMVRLMRSQPLVALLRGAVFGLIAISSVVLILRSGWGLDKFGDLDALSMDIIALKQEEAARSRAAYLTGLQVRSPLDLIWQTPLRVVYFLFAPFPWMVRSAADVFGLLDAAIYVYLALRIFRGRAAVRSRPAARAVRFAALGVIVGFALVVSNYGTAIRHRAKVAPLLVAVAAGAMRPRHGRVGAEPQTGRPYLEPAGV